MDSTYLHLLINELPLVGVLVGLIMLVSGLLLKSPAIKRASLITFIFSALLAVPSYFSGISAHDKLVRMDGIDQAYVASHRTVAYEFVRMIALLAIFAIVTLILDKTEKIRASKVFYVITLAAGIFMFFMTQSIGSTGREIRHTEIRADSLHQH